MKVLWLASLYPSELFPYDGDFIQRHARAVSTFCDIELIHVVKDPEGRITRDVKCLEKTNGRLIERIIYYKPFSTSIPLVDRLLSSLKYKKVFRSAVKDFVAEQGTPQFIHLHMAMKAGLIALWAKRNYAIPFILTEHWGAYLPEARPNMTDRSFIFRHYLKKIVEEASACSFVSAYFQKQMLMLFRISNSRVIPNVVDTRIFFPVIGVQHEGVRFIHVSSMIYQKNTEAILEAIHLLKSDQPVILDLFGPPNDSIRNLIRKLNLKDSVLLHGEVRQEVLAKAMQDSDALILYSRFETFGCVLIEAQACGIPVIVSNLEVFKEIVEEGFNGMFVGGEDSRALTEKLKEFIKVKNSFNKKQIAEYSATRYNFEKVGQQFLELYNNFNK